MWQQKHEKVPSMLGVKGYHSLLKLLFISLYFISVERLPFFIHLYTIDLYLCDTLQGETHTAGMLLICGPTHVMVDLMTFV